MKKAEVWLYEFRVILLTPLRIRNAHGLSFNVLFFHEHFNFPVIIFQVFLIKIFPILFSPEMLYCHKQALFSVNCIQGFSFEIRTGNLAFSFTLEIKSVSLLSVYSTHILRN